MCHQASTRRVQACAAAIVCWYCNALTPRPASASAQVPGSTSSAVTVRPAISDSSSTSRSALAATTWRNVATSSESSSAAGDAISTVCPSDSSVLPAASAAAAHSGVHLAHPGDGVDPDPDAQRARVGVHDARVRAVGRRGRVRIAGHLAGEHVEDRGGVAHRPGHDVAGHEPVPHLAVLGAERHAAARRLEPDEAALARRDADRSAAVARVRDRHHARRDRSRRSAARAPDAARRVPRVVRGAVGVGFGRRLQPELRRVRLADDHEAGLLELVEQVGGVGRDVADLLQQLVAEVERHAREPTVEVLHHDRDAGERSGDRRGGASAARGRTAGG